jgi:tetratricopeptide (TPR) repeat protein
MDVLAMATEISPQEIILHELLADMLDTVGRKEQAMEHYRICANLDPSASRIREKMARLYLSQGKKEEAKIEWNKLLTLDPTQKPVMP